ncbi:MAG: MFS transporter [Kofleriaceae bacterium]|nr:MFS transporter [Kofleriaceae bacterium]MCB9575282.1 MFS transporter [Kofleriaceae bacterium]
MNKPPKKAKKPEPPLWQKLIPIVLLLLVIGVVVTRLPKIDVGHTPAYRRRRLLNWLPLGLTYAFLYMARYNLNQYMYVGGITEREFGDIFAVGSLVYGLAFVLNGPLTDWLGGRFTILIAAAGSAACNAAMGYMVLTGDFFGSRVGALTVLYAGNMYFQSFGAVSIVKVNAAWFHLRERGTFGGIFGILISLGLFFAYDGGRMITDNFHLPWLFFIPAMMLVVFFVLSFIWVRNDPADAGFASFDVGDASSHDDGKAVGVVAVIWKVVSNPIILLIATVELCSGFLRQAILQWGRNFGKGAGLADSFVFHNWGVVSCIAGILGGMFAGAISDHVFGSRRLPVTAVLYAIMLSGAVAIVPLFAAPAMIPWVIAFMSMAIIGVHGMLSGTASQDFGGKKNAGIAVGIIDGFVYLGSTIQSSLYGRTLPADKLHCPDGSSVANPAARVISNWHIWPYAMIPAAVIGLGLSIWLWNVKVGGKKQA